MDAKPWLKHYPKGIKGEIDVESYSSVMDLIDESLEKYSDLIAFECMGKGLTYAEIDKLSKDFAAYLQGLGLEKGDRIAIQMPNILQYPVVLFGAIRAGLIVVNTNPLYTPREMQHQFKDSGAKALVVVSMFADKVEHILPNTDIEHVVITDLGDLLGGLKGTIVNFVVKYIRKMVPSYNLPKAVPFKKAMSIGAGQQYVKPKVELSDVGFLQYTGGTTGVAKGATLTHGNVVANMLQITEWVTLNLEERKEVVITPLPLYHIFAFTVNCLTMLRLGARNKLITNPRDMNAFIKELKKEPFTLMTGVNTLFVGLMNQPEFAEVDFSKLKIVVGGGMAVQKPVNDQWKSITGKPIVEGYGLSETSPVLTCNPVDGTDRIGTIGIPVPNTDVKVMDENGKEVPLGESGEICAKGPQVMKGYWNRDDETAKVFHEGGWFRTGDIGVMDEDGFFQIVDRLKDMILVSGFNVYPNEVEEVVVSHPKVLECAAIGVPDPKSNEAVKICVVRKDASLTQEELRAFCKENLTGYKVPRHYEFMEELPKSNVGKILRRELREMVGGPQVKA